MTSTDNLKSVLDVLYQKPCLYLPEVEKDVNRWEKDIHHRFADLKRSNRKLREQLDALIARNTELEAYAHTVAHNLKNPLCAIIVTTDAISDITDLKPKEQREYLQMIRTTAYEMNGIIDNLLLLSEVSKREIPNEIVDMKSTVSNIRRRLRTMAREYHARIISPNSWPDAMGYSPWIEEVWINYVSNAVKYGGTHPLIELGATPLPGSKVRYWVRDHGHGVPVDNRTNLFTQYPQVVQTHMPGHGLGLSIVQRIVEKLGGQVGMESEEGKGSLFFFTLQAADPEGGNVPEKRAASAEHDPPSDEDGRRIISKSVRVNIPAV